MSGRPARCIALHTAIEEIHSWDDTPQQEMGLILLEESSKGNYNLHTDWSCIYSTNYFTPIALPIWGTANEWSFPENIKKDVNTKAVCKRLGLKKIEDLKDMLHSGDEVQIGKWEHNEKGGYSIHFPKFIEEPKNFMDNWDFEKKRIVACVISKEGYDLLKTQPVSDDYGAGKKYDQMASYERQYDQMVADITLANKYKVELKKRKEEFGEEKEKGDFYKSLPKIFKEAIDGNYERVTKHTGGSHSGSIFSSLGFNQNTGRNIAKMLKPYLTEEHFEELRRPILDFTMVHSNLDALSRLFIPAPADDSGNYTLERQVREKALEIIQRQATKYDED